MLNYLDSKDGMSIQYKGKWSKVLAAVHTHPKIPMGVASHSPFDKGWINGRRTFGIVLVFNGQAYGMIPVSSSVINFSSNADLINGKISIIKHYNALMQYFKSNH